MPATSPTTTSDAPHQAVSTDGTSIAYWSSGAGPPLLLVHGAMSDHRRWRITPHLEPHRTVHRMDRRGRGGSGDAPDWSLDREVDDVVAVTSQIATDAGAPVDVLGHSLGGLLALRAAARSSDVRRLVLYEPAVNESAQPDELLARMRQELAAGHPERVILLMMREVVHMPEPEIEALQAQPAWPSRVATAPTVPRELAVPLSWDAAEGSRVTVPTMLVLGGDSPAFVVEGTRLVADAVPDSRVVVLPGQQHVADQMVPEQFAAHVLDFVLPDVL